MYQYFIDEAAAAELLDAQHVYRSYFARFGQIEKGERWARRFLSDYTHVIESLKNNPFLYSACRVFPFNLAESTYRTFCVGWFTVFYTVEDKSFTVWHIRSSRSDFRDIG